MSFFLCKLLVVRGVAVNHVDHPHGGGEGCIMGVEGRTKGGRPSISPWGNPLKQNISHQVWYIVFNKSIFRKLSLENGSTFVVKITHKK
jgi:ribosomal protein L2